MYKVVMKDGKPTGAYGPNDGNYEPLLKEGETIEIMAKPPVIEPSYTEKRAREYPSVVDQLDILYNEGYEGWKAKIKAIKDKYRKE